MKFQLINPLLGAHCNIGSNDNPVIINPSVTGTLVVEKDPHPRIHPDTDVLKIKGSNGHRPHHMAKILLSAFTAKVTAAQEPGRRITFASLRDGRYGFR